MKRWSIGTNNYYFTSSIYLDEAPWYIFFLEEAIQWICHYTPRIPLPRFIKIQREGYEYSLRDWYGTTADLFHVYICTPVFNWCWDKTKKNDIEFPYEMIKEMFPEKFNEEDEYRIDKDDDDYEEELEDFCDNKVYSEHVGMAFKVIYNDLENIYKDRRKELDKKNSMRKITREVNSDKVIGESSDICPDCKQPWEEHEFGVPSPYCPCPPKGDSNESN